MIMFNWIVLTESVIGASHTISKKPNQDCIRSKQYTDNNFGQVTIVALADGHGSDKYCRSDIGASVAVDVAIDEIVALLKFHPFSYHELSQLKKLPTIFVSSWREKVQKHYHQVSLTEEELLILKNTSKEKPDKGNNFPFFLYGCTLLVICITDEHTIYIQLGDGDILCLDNKEKVYHPIKSNPELMANETYSMCMVNPEKYFIIFSQKLTDDLQIPELIMLASDGYKNSFVTNEDFFKVANDYCKMFDSYLSKKIQENLSKFLSNTSMNGSGDDISIGLIKRFNINTLDYRKMVSSMVNNLSELTNTIAYVNQIEKKIGDLTLGFKELRENHHQYGKTISKIEREIFSIQEVGRLYIEVNEKIDKIESCNRKFYVRLLLYILILAISFAVLLMISFIF